MGKNKRITVTELKTAVGPDFERLLEETAGVLNSARREGAIIADSEEGAAGLLVKIHETRKAVRSRPKRQTLKALEQYVAKRAEMMDYPTFRACGFDIGSGPTEAFCKTLISRLKGSGMR